MTAVRANRRAVLCASFGLRFARASCASKVLADKQYLELVARSADNFIAGSIHDEIWRAL